MCLHPITELQIGKLRPSKRNARVHSKKQIEQIVSSIRRFGWTYPILIDELGNILCRRPHNASIFTLVRVGFGAFLQPVPPDS
jgi:ParB-like nuclease domain